MKLIMALMVLSLSPYVHAADQREVKMENFKKPTVSELKQKLTPAQFDVTQKEGTERPFENPYWDNHEAGIYVDVVSGEPLFSSLDKFESGTGWPSFSRPLESENVVTKTDRKFLFMTRTEVRSKHADSHLGHVFEDGPKPTGMRYCLNSASLRFVPVSQLEKAGYGKYLGLFEKKAGAPDPSPSSSRPVSSVAPITPRVAAGLQVATMAGGCFWGVEDLLRKLPGVVEIAVGYSGGGVPNAKYEQVKKGGTGHAEAVQLIYDPKKISYEEILKFFFKLHDPTTLDQQGNDVGSQYRSVVFYHDDQQRQTAEKIKQEVDQSGKWKRPVVTAIEPAKEFYRAEEYHQDYLVKNPGGYTCHYVRN